MRRTPKPPLGAQGEVAGRRPDGGDQSFRSSTAYNPSVSLRLTAPLTQGSLFLRRRASKPPLEGRWHAKRDGEVCRPEGGGAEAPLAHAEALREAIGAVTPLRRSAPAPLKGSLCLRRRVPCTRRNLAGSHWCGNTSQALRASSPQGEPFPLMRRGLCVLPWDDSSPLRLGSRGSRRCTGRRRGSRCSAGRAAWPGQYTAPRRPGSEPGLRSK